MAYIIWCDCWSVKALRDVFNVLLGFVEEAGRLSSYAGRLPLPCIVSAIMECCVADADEDAPLRAL